jgi:hypothetical protein
MRPSVAGGENMVLRRVLLAMALSVSLTTVACDDSTTTGGDAGLADVTTDSTTGGDAAADSSVPDTSAPDSTVEPDAVPDGANPPDAVADTTVTPDATTPDAEADAVADGTVSDTVIVPDVVPDATEPDAVADTTPDATEPDAVADTTPDTAADTTEDTGPDVIVPPGEGYYSHVVAVELIENAAEFGCDGNNDGKVDAADGDINGLIGTLASFGVDANAELAATVSEGSLILLLELLGFNGTATANATLDLLIGDDIEVQPDPSCGVGSKLESKCDWVASDSSYDEFGVPKVTVSGAAAGNGKLSAGPANIGFAVPITDGLVLDLDIQNGTIKGDMSGKFAVTNGRICGSVPKQSIKDGLNAACEGPGAPSFCSAVGFLDLILTCDQCSVVIAFESVEALSVSPPML